MNPYEVNMDDCPCLKQYVDNIEDDIFCYKGYIYLVSTASICTLSQDYTKYMWRSAYRMSITNYWIPYVDTDINVRLPDNILQLCSIWTCNIFDIPIADFINKMLATGD